MPEPHWCPACDYGRDEDKTLPAVRAHVNSSNTDHPDWADLKADVEAQAEDDGGNDSSSTEPDDGGNSDTSQSESSDSDDGDPYEEQWSDAADPGGSDQETPDDGPENAESGGVPLYLLAGAGVAVGLLILVLILKDSDDGEEPETVPSEVVDEDEQSDENAEEMPLVET